MPQCYSQRVDSTRRVVSPAVLRDERTDLLKRAEQLLPPDKFMVELAVKSHLSHRQLARVLGQPCGTLSRRMQRVANRLLDPIVIALLEPALPLRDEYRQLGIEYFLQGRTVAELADRHRMTRIAVQRALGYVRGWHQGLTSRWR